MRFLLLSAIALMTTVGAVAKTNVEKEMLDTFVKYTAINSQSHDDSLYTAGEYRMALAIKADADAIVAETGAKGVDVIMSPECYVYVDIPSNIKGSCPTLGISCHLDVTPEIKSGEIHPVVDTRDGHTIVRTDGTTLLGADDKCGCTIAMQLVRTLLRDKKIKHGRVVVAFCPREDVGHSADNIDAGIFSPDILFDLDGEEGKEVTISNFTARSFDVRFIGKEAHPGYAKAEKYGDAVAAAAEFVAFIPAEYRPENTEGEEGYIHPWSFKQKGVEMDVTVKTRLRYFDKKQGELFDKILADALAQVARKFPNVTTEVLNTQMQYENVAYTLYPGIKDVVAKAAATTGKEIEFKSARGGTTAAMMAAKGQNGGLCLFTGQHEIHSTREWADLTEMAEAYDLMLQIIKDIPKIN